MQAYTLDNASRSVLHIQPVDNFQAKVPSSSFIMRQDSAADWQLVNFVLWICNYDTIAIEDIHVPSHYDSVYANSRYLSLMYNQSLQTKRKQNMNEINTTIVHVAFKRHESLQESEIGAWTLL